MPFSYEKILYNKNLKERITELFRLESVGYSHIDIARQLFKHVCCDFSKIDYSIILGDAIEHLNHFEHDPYYLYDPFVNYGKLIKN